ncbi:hypothetical protein Moror_7073 [Moniliophthora roreri MCA 2997]|uniref:GATA-type domain-containing protein n=1 Tax=Moniliophthora roreri (strain MCA 2997) TaxID=1381753 RepID=V2XRC9_MONRO|nr:hypothetical protein Moror_7073 [Moniliophthora roreri MCA 2997]
MWLCPGLSPPKFPIELNNGMYPLESQEAEDSYVLPKTRSSTLLTYHLIHRHGGQSQKRVRFRRLDVPTSGAYPKCRAELHTRIARCRGSKKICKTRNSDRPHSLPLPLRRDPSLSTISPVVVDSKPAFGNQITTESALISPPKMNHDMRDNTSNRQPSQGCANCYTTQACRWYHRSPHYDGKRVCYNCYSYAVKTGRKRPPRLQSKLNRYRFGGAAYAPECPSSRQRCSECGDGSLSDVVWLHSIREPRTWLCGRCGAVELQKNNKSPTKVPPSRRERTWKSPTPDTSNNNDSHIESDSADSDFSVNSDRKCRLRKPRDQADATSTTKQNVVNQPQPPYTRRGSTRVRIEKLNNGSKLRRGSSPAKPFVTRQRENRDIFSTAVPTSADQEIDTSSSTLPEIRKEFAMLLSLVVEVEMVSRVAGIPETQASIEAALDLVREMLAHHGVQHIVRLMELLVESKLNLQAGNMERMAASMKDCRKLVESRLA